MVAIVVAATAFVSRVPAQQAEPTLACDKREVSYSAPDPTFEQRIKLSDAKESTIPTEARDKKRSPQGTRYLLLQSADFSKPGPWTTTVFIGGAGLNGQVLKVSFVDHGNGGVHAQWLNEKLVFVDVWWGRIASTDLILDVSSRKFLYKEDAEYGDMIQPCR
jgi:hypothetical protein